MTKRQQMNLVILFIGIFILMANGYDSFLKPLDNTIINFIQGLENPMLTRYIFKYDQYSRYEAKYNNNSYNSYNFIRK